MIKSNLRAVYFLLIIIGIISSISFYYSLSNRKIDSSDKNNASIAKEIEISNDNEYIKWRYIADNSWNNLIAISDLKGQNGKDGIDGKNGKKGKNGINGTDGINGIDGENGTNGINGINAKNIELDIDKSILRWRYVGDQTWTNLIDIANLSLFDNHNPAILSVNGQSDTLGCVTIDETCSKGTMMVIQVGPNEVYNFYVLDDDGETLTLIMDRNLELPAAWNNENLIAEGPINLITVLANRTSTWTNIDPIDNYSYNNLDYVNNSQGYQNISITEGIATIIKGDGTSNVLTTSPIRSRIITQEEANTLGCRTTSGSCPSWLTENLVNQNNTLTPYGYWTLTSHYTSSNRNHSYSIHYNGSLNAVGVVDVNKGRGIRPIIVIEKYVNREN